MKRKKRNNDIHTNTKGFSLTLRLIRKGLKILGFIAPRLAIMLVSRKFRKPVRKKILEKQELFYQNGITDTLTIEGHTVKVLRRGSGKSVFLVHGWGSYGYDMRHMVDALVREGYHVILPDLPCHGRSSGKFTEQVIMAKVIKTMLLHYNAQSPIEKIVTHSWGGTATLLALDMIKKGNYMGFEVKNMISMSMPTRLNAVMDIFCAVLGLSERIKKGLLAKVDKIAESGNRTVEEVFPLGLNDLLEQPEFDYLLIHGKRDRAIPYINSVQLANKFPNIRLQLEERMGHMNITMRTATHDAVLNHLATPAAAQMVESIAS